MLSLLLMRNDGVAEQAGDAEGGDGQPARIVGDGIGGDELVDQARLEPLIGQLAENAVADGRPHAEGPAVAENLRGGDEGAGRLGDVIGPAARRSH